MVETSNHCVACIETIHARARICPHCGSHQRSLRWQGIAASLRWIGGTAALLSLLLASSQIHDVYSIWTERQESVAELVGAANEETKLGELKRAWKTLDLAREIDAASKLVRESRFELALEIARERTIWKEEEWSGPSGSVIDVLFRGATSADSRVAARAYAHLAWIKVRKQLAGGSWITSLWEEASPLLLRALDRDSNEPYTNVMWGYLVLFSKPDGTPEERLARALEHFARVRPESEEQADSLRQIELAGLSRGPSPARVEGLRRAVAFVEAGSVLDRRTRERYLELLSCLPYLDLKSPNEHERERYIEPARRLVEGFSYAELASAFYLLDGEQGYDDLNQDNLTTGNRGRAAAEAVLHERLGRIAEARALQQKLAFGRPSDIPHELAILALERLALPPVGAAPDF